VAVHLGIVAMGHARSLTRIGKPRNYHSDGWTRPGARTQAGAASASSPLILANGPSVIVWAPAASWGPEADGGGGRADDWRRPVGASPRGRPASLRGRGTARRASGRRARPGSGTLPRGRHPFPRAEVPRGAAHAWAALGHLREAELRLAEQGRTHRLKACLWRCRSGARSPTACDPSASLPRPAPSRPERAFRVAGTLIGRPSPNQHRRAPCIRQGQARCARPLGTLRWGR
jgi:hypothetical protein